MFTSEMKKIVDKLIMQHGVAAVYSVINSVTCCKKRTNEYNAEVHKRLNEVFGK